MAKREKLAVNPLPWVIGSDGFDLSERTLRPALAELGEAGFDALQADIPSAWTVAQYRDLLDEYGFRPAPGYFGAAFDDPTEHPALVEAARRHAAAQAELGLTVAFVASDLTPARIARPAQGTDASADRLRIVSDGLAKVSEAALGEGVRYALHPHVGSWVETEDETRQVLDATAGAALAFGPDTGHLSWAGAAPETLIADYADRVVALHLKDVDGAAVGAARAAEADYWEATNMHHVWTEPGRGRIDFAAVLAALPAGFDGWSVVEVDVPNLPTPVQSARTSRENLLAMPFFASEGVNA
ncbi:sugar phosphate isomerase/epimerase [Okibacterium endophyticum]